MGIIEETELNFEVGGGGLLLFEGKEDKEELGNGRTYAKQRSLEVRGTGGLEDEF